MKPSLLEPFLLIFKKRLPKRIKTAQYTRKWRSIQRLCARKDDWAHAIVHADMLVDEVLRKRKIAGKTMGERLVNAQAKLSANEAIWDAHKFASTLRHEGARVVKESEVKEALVAFRQALRDLGAL